MASYRKVIEVDRLGGEDSRFYREEREQVRVLALQKERYSDR